MGTDRSDFVKLFIFSIMETIKVQCERTFVAGKTMKEPDKMFDSLPVILSGTIGVTSRIFSGTISLSFPEDTFLYIMEGMLGEKFEEIDQDLIDGCGELLNIAFGSAKKVMNSKGFALEKAIPTIIKGNDIKVNYVGKSPIVAVPFSSDDYKFLVVIGIDNHSEQ